MEEILRQILAVQQQQLELLQRIHNQGSDDSDLGYYDEPPEQNSPFYERVFVNNTKVRGAVWYKLSTPANGGRKMEVPITAKAVRCRIVALEIFDSATIGQNRGLKLKLYAVVNNNGKIQEFESGNPFSNPDDPIKYPGNAYSRGLIARILDMSDEQLAGKIWLIPTESTEQNSQMGYSLLNNILDANNTPIIAHSWKRDKDLDWEDMAQQAIEKVNRVCGGLPKDRLQSEDSTDEPSHSSPQPQPRSQASARPVQPAKNDEKHISGTLADKGVLTPFKESVYLLFTITDENNTQHPCVIWQRDAEAFARIPLGSQLAITGNMMQRADKSWVLKATAVQNLSPKDPLDLSDLIAEVKTHTERLGWSKDYLADTLDHNFHVRETSVLGATELRRLLDYMRSQ